LFPHRIFHVLSYIADELESQQGIAHLTEHVAYMGSRKRERLFGTGSQTNAYTDFHHTVFYAACPTILPGSRSTSDGGNTNKMLPLALDALADVMEARVEPSRLEKERAAVLSEMTMVNTIEYRVECQILSALHRENRLSKRFPIGKEILIKNWKPTDVKTWHRTHYRPDNVLLYIVGDIADKDGGVSEVIQTIQQKFGHITADKQAVDILPSVAPEASQIADALNVATVKAKQSWHYPPVIHEWCVDEKNDILKDVPVVSYDIHLRNPMPLDEKVDFLSETKLTPNGIRIRPHIFRLVVRKSQKTTIILLFSTLFSIVRQPIHNMYYQPPLPPPSFFLIIYVKLDMNFYNPFRCTCLPNGLCNPSSTYPPFVIVWQEGLH